jgi:hypothetical protein
MIPELAHLHSQQLLIQVLSKNAKTDSLKLLDSVNPMLKIRSGERLRPLPIFSAPVFCSLMLEGPLIDRHLFYVLP